jgi:hypothetical protein
MRYVAAFICVFTLLGCNSEVEQRRQHTLERMDYGGGTAESRRVQQLIVTALEQADTASLQSPQVVNVTMRVVPDDTKRGTLGVDWISAQPAADGIRVRFGDGSQSDIPFDDIEIEYNEQVAEIMVLFVGNPFVEREHPDVWKKLLTDPEAVVVLINNGEVVSNEQSIHRVEFGG